MSDLEKVVQALEICASREPGKYTCDKCPYETRVDGDGCEVNLMLDAMDLLKEQEAEIRQLRLALDIAKGTCKGIVAERR